MVTEDTKLSYRVFGTDGSLTFGIGADSAVIAIGMEGEALERLIYTLITARNHLRLAHHQTHPDVNPARMYVDFDS